MLSIVEIFYGDLEIDDIPIENSPIVRRHTVKKPA